jgi:hypothetical protein
MILDSNYKEPARSRNKHYVTSIIEQRIPKEREISIQLSIFL